MTIHQQKRENGFDIFRNWEAKRLLGITKDRKLAIYRNEFNEWTLWLENGRRLNFKEMNEIESVFYGKRINGEKDEGFLIVQSENIEVFLKGLQNEFSQLSLDH